MKLSETTTHGITCKCGETFQTPEALTEHIAAHRWQPNPQDRQTRQPTDEELDDLIQWYQDKEDRDRQETVHLINQGYYILIEDYTTYCPGYTGRVLIEIGSGDPSHLRIYTWHEDGLQQSKPETASVRQGGS